MYICPLGNSGGSGFLCFRPRPKSSFPIRLSSAFLKSPVVTDVGSVPQIQEPLVEFNLCVHRPLFRGLNILTSINKTRHWDSVSANGSRHVFLIWARIIIQQHVAVGLWIFHEIFKSRKNCWFLMIYRSSCNGLLWFMKVTHELSLWIRRHRHLQKRKKTLTLRPLYTEYQELREKNTL